MKKQYIVKLTQAERESLQKLISSGKASARQLTHARILRKAEGGKEHRGWTDQAIAQALEVGESTVYRVRRRFVEQGLQAALQRSKPRRVYRRQLDGEQEAHLVALACSCPPPGQARWTLRLLADRMVELHYVQSVSHETVRQVMKKTNSSRG